MRTWKWIAVALAGMWLFSGCNTLRITGSGKLVDRSFANRDFERIELSHAFEAQIVRAEGFSIELSVDDQVLPHLAVKQTGKTLRIGLKSGPAYSLNHCQLKARIGLPRLRGLSLSGSSQASLSGFGQLEKLEADLSGASSLTGDVQATRLDLDLSGASEARLSGRVENLDLDASGASDAHLENLTSARTAVDVSGASEARVLVNGPLSVSASGASRVVYAGQAVLAEVDTSGASDVSRAPGSTTDE